MSQMEFDQLQQRVSRIALQEPEIGGFLAALVRVVAHDTNMQVSNDVDELATHAIAKVRGA